MNNYSKKAFYKLESELRDFDPVKGRIKVKEQANLLRQELRADIKLHDRTDEVFDFRSL